MKRIITIKDEWEVPEKHFEHDCTNCVFVGNVIIVEKQLITYQDIYVCSRDEESGSLIIRNSSEGSDYASRDIRAIAINSRSGNYKEGYLEHAMNKLIEDNILKLQFKWEFTPRGYRCAQCDTPVLKGEDFCSPTCKELFDIEFANLTKKGDIK